MSWKVNEGEKLELLDVFSEVHLFAETESARRNFRSKCMQ